MWSRAFAVWLLLMTAETLHGVLRTLLLAPRLGDFRARQVAVLTGSAIVLAITRGTARWLGAPTVRARLAVGAVWVALTLGFEIGVGRATGLSWERLGSDYDLRHGGLLPFGLLVLFVAPLVTGRPRPRSAR